MGREGTEEAASPAFSALRRLLGADDLTCSPTGGAFVSERQRWLIGRPSLPLTLWLAAGMWLGIAVSYGSLREKDILACQTLTALAAVALCVCTVVLVASSWRALVAVALAGILLGAVCGCATAWKMHAVQQELWGCGGEAIVELAQDGLTGSFGQTATGRMQMPSGGFAVVRVNVADAPPLMAGQRIAVEATWREPSPSSAVSLWEKGVTATANAPDCRVLETVGPASAIRSLRANAVSLMDSLEFGDGGRAATGADDAPGQSPAPVPTGGAEFLEAVLLGWRDGIFDSEWYAAAKVDGLAHMVAVSGAHLAIVCGLALAALQRLQAPRSVRLAVQLLLICSYLVLTGVAVSAVRAAFMTVIGLSAFLVRRRAYSLGALSFAVIALLALDPLCAFSLSFALSVGSTLGIVLFARYFSEWMGVLFRRGHVGSVLQSVAMCLAAQLVANPLSAGEFGQVSLISPLANVLMAPCFTIVCGIGLPVTVAAAAFGIGSSVLDALAHACSWLCLLLQVLADLPHAAIPVYLDPIAVILLAAILPFALWAVWPRPSWQLICTLAAVCIAACAFLSLSALERGDEVIMLDVGQGDAFVLRSRGRTMLIDTGNRDDLLLKGLARQGIHHLDAVAITHADDDHCGSLSALKGTVGVDCVVLARDMLSCGESKAVNLVRTAADVAGDACAVKGVSVGERLVVGGFAIDVIGPDRFTAKGGNADSLALLMKADDDDDGVADWHGLFCGDAESEQIAAYLEAGRIGDIDIFKVGHHGSRAAVDETVASALRPEICLVSVGARNRYGHPVPSTLQTLEGVGGTVWRTDRQGDVVCRLTPARIQVASQRAD